MESFVLFNSSANRVVFWETFLFFNTMSGCFAVDLEDLVEDFLFLAFDFFMTVEELCLWWWWWTAGPGGRIHKIRGLLFCSF